MIPACNSVCSCLYTLFIYFKTSFLELLLLTKLSKYEGKGESWIIQLNQGHPNTVKQPLFAMTLFLDLPVKNWLVAILTNFHDQDENNLMGNLIIRDIWGPVHGKKYSWWQIFREPVKNFLHVNKSWFTVDKTFLM